MPMTVMSTLFVSIHWVVLSASVKQDSIVSEVGVKVHNILLITSAISKYDVSSLTMQILMNVLGVYTTATQMLDVLINKESSCVYATLAMRGVE